LMRWSMPPTERSAALAMLCNRGVALQRFVVLLALVSRSRSCHLTLPKRDDLIHKVMLVTLG